MAFDFKFPDVGEGLTEGEVVSWKVKVGDLVQSHQAILEVETDKAVVEIPSPETGFILSLKGVPGDIIKVGEVIAVIGSENELKASQAKAPPESQGTVVVATVAEAKAESLGKGAGSVKGLVQGAGSHPMSLSLMELPDGAELQSKGESLATEILYFISGGGSLQVAGETFPLAPEAMVYLPRGTVYTIKAAPGEKGDKILVLQFKIPVAGRPPRVAAPAASKK